MSPKVIGSYTFKLISFFFNLKNNSDQDPQGGNGKGGKGAVAKRAKSKHLNVETIERKYNADKQQQKFKSILRYIENYRLHIFWLTLYTLVVAAVFTERAYCK